MMATELRTGSPETYPEHASLEADTQPMQRLISAAELGAFPMIFFPALWYFSPQGFGHSLLPFYFGGLTALLLYAVYVSPVLIHKHRLPSLGLGGAGTFFVRTDNLGPALRLYGSVLLIGGLLIIAAALHQRPHLFMVLNWKAFFVKLLFYSISGMLQGFLMASCLLRLKALFPSTTVRNGIDSVSPPALRHRFLVSMLYALLFSACHLPNAPVMIIALTYGFIAAWIYYSIPNLFVAAACHAVLGTLLHRVYELNMRIGPSYYDSDLHVIRTLFPIIGRLIGNLY